MAGIQPTSGITPGRLSGPTAGGGVAKPQGGGEGFADAMKQAVNAIDQDQQASASAIRDLIAGKNQDTLPVVQAMAKADLSFKLLMGVRNKVIEAYKETMRMQV